MATNSGLTHQQIAHFQRDGYLALRGLLPQEDLQPLIDELAARVEIGIEEAIAAGVLAAEDVYEGASFAQRLELVSAACAESGWIWERHFRQQKIRSAGMFVLRTSEVLLDAVGSLIGSEIYAHPQFNLRAKMPEQEVTVIPWHQDLAYLNPEEAGETLVVNAWIPLVAATLDNGCMQVIRGSHRLGLLAHNYRDETPGHTGGRGIREEELPAGDVFSAELDVGDVLLTTERLVHRGTLNRSQTVRWSVDTRYSQLGLPTGRESVPGFVARSRQDPASVIRDHQEWNRIFAAV